MFDFILKLWTHMISYIFKWIVRKKKKRNKESLHSVSNNSAIEEISFVIIFFSSYAQLLY